MRVGAAPEHLLVFGRDRRTENQSSSVQGGLYSLASRLAAARSGLSEASPPSEYNTKYHLEERYKEQEQLEQRDIVERRVRYTTRDIVETRDVFGDRDILEAKVAGSKSISGLRDTTEAGIALNSGFTVAVGENAPAQITFGNNKVTVTVGGVKREFEFKDASAASFQKAVVDGLNSISGVSAALTAEGHLQLTSSQMLTLGEHHGNSAVSALGLQAGATNTSVVGYEHAKIGTEQVVVGTKQVANGIERTVVGTETVKIGTTKVLEGSDRVAIGLERSSYFGLLNKVASTSSAGILDVMASVVNSSRRLFSEPEGRSAYAFVEQLREYDPDESSGRRLTAKSPSGSEPLDS